MARARKGAFASRAVEAAFAAYPTEIRRELMALRALIFDAAANTPLVGEIEETLKWGEPAYLTSRTRSGTTIRLGWKPAAPAQFAMYFNCRTNLIETFRTLFRDELEFEGNRAIVLRSGAALPIDALRLCIDAALTYHLRKKKDTKGDRAGRDRGRAGARL